MYYRFTKSSDLFESLIQMVGLKCNSDLIYSSAIDTQIRITNTGGRANLNHPGIGVNEKFKVVNKPEKAATTFKMKIILVLGNKRCAGHLAHYVDQTISGIRY